jgi:hypothetical protein
MLVNTNRYRILDAGGWSLDAGGWTSFPDFAGTSLG